MPTSATKPARGGAGKDPGDLAQHDPDALRRAVEESVPFLRFRFDRALAGQDLTSPEGKARAADRVLPVIAEHPDEIVRGAWSGIATIAARYTNGDWPFDGSMQAWVDGA